MNLRDETIARWWVQLNGWVWPEDLPGKPERGDDRQAVRGAWAVVNVLAEKRGLLKDGGPIDSLWQDDDRRNDLLRPLDEVASR